MIRSPRPRKAVSVSNSFHRQLTMYALAASAAGVGVLAMAPPAEGKIVYTPAHRTIAPHQAIPLDVNHDGKVDFRFKDTLSTTSASFFHSGRLSIFPLAANQIWGHKTAAGLHYASALPAGVKIGPSGAFSAGSRSMAYGRQEGSSFYCEGKWNNVTRRYLGLKFMIAGKVHFGWARLNVTCNAPKVRALLTGYAYETIPGKSIVAGQTNGVDDAEQLAAASPNTQLPESATLGVLAVGAPALSIWRRE